MAWHVERSEPFEKALKVLLKRFPFAAHDILEEFKAGPPQHTCALPKCARKLWKARAPSTDLRRGKSGGFRIIYFWDEALPNWCCLGTAYFKGDQEDLAPQELDRLLVTFKTRLEKFVDLVKEIEDKPQSGEES